MKATTKAPPVPVAEFLPAQTKATLGTATLDLDTLGPWSANVKTVDALSGSERDSVGVQRAVELGDVALRVRPA